MSGPADDAAAAAPSARPAPSQHPASPPTETADLPPAQPAANPTDRAAGSPLTSTTTVSPPEGQADQDVGLDLLGQAVAPCDPPGPRARPPRGSLTVTTHITWINGPHTEALRKTQGRAVRAALAALVGRAHRQAEPPASPR